MLLKHRPLWSHTAPLQKLSLLLRKWLERLRLWLKSQFRFEREQQSGMMSEFFLNGWQCQYLLGDPPGTGSQDMQFYTNSHCLADQKTQESKQTGLSRTISSFFSPFILDSALESSETSEPGKTITEFERKTVS